MSPENFLDCPPSFSWLRSNPSSDDTQTEPDFEFPLEHPATMLPADQLFSDGKLLPLHIKPSQPHSSPENPKSRPSSSASTTDLNLFSPKAPRCSSRWKDLLGLKKLYQTTNNPSTKTTSPSSQSPSSSTSFPNKSLKHFLHRSKTPSLSSESAPLLVKDSDSESLSISSRLSLSSSSSSHEHDDLPRLSLDSEKPNPNLNPNPISLHRNPNPRVRLVKSRPASFDGNKTDHHNRVGRSPIRREQHHHHNNSTATTNHNTTTNNGSSTVQCRGVSVDSPRMNSSGKIVFQSLERSSSSPSSFNGGPRFKHRGMERSYSANVRVTPVLNVPVCSLRGGSKTGSVFGFGQLFSSPQKKDGVGGGNKSHGRNRN
ncbi:hypothetical protein RJT34_29432 [Clitoria ternatea]|uniref:Uncharacterized protein n=1 Tax=Clitoria ternatea TaxID=43366 RepID=A0AAN9F9Z5_CLITE